MNFSIDAKMLFKSLMSTAFTTIALVLICCITYFKINCVY